MGTPPGKLNAGRAFVWMERYLDTTQRGPMFLRQTARPTASWAVRAWVRDEREWEKIAEYLEENPVQAGVAVTAEEYPWPSAVASAPA